MSNLILQIDSPKKISLNIRNLNYRAGNIILGIDIDTCPYMDIVHTIDFTQTLEMHVIVNITTKQSH